MENEKVKEYISKIKSSLPATKEPKGYMPFDWRVLMAGAGKQVGAQRDRAYQNSIRLVEKRRAELREEREAVCFPIVNRGQVWYNTLTETQRNEIAVWYKAWLDVTETLVPPIMPTWLH